MANQELKNKSSAFSPFKKLPENLPAELYRVAMAKGTERPFSGRYVNEKSAGQYHCAVCGHQLFASSAKFDSGTGWPSFDQALAGAVKHEEDASAGLKRTEVLCANCAAHLGHVFNDGPQTTGQRYCINSICLNLKKDH